MRRVFLGIALGLLTSALLLWAADKTGIARRKPRPPNTRLVPEDASGPLSRVAIHYAPLADDLALPVWRQLFAVLPGDIAIDVAVGAERDFVRFLEHLRRAGIPYLERFRPVTVGREISTWSRDRFAALAGPDGGGVLAPPAVETPFAPRAGDFAAPMAIARAVWGLDARIAKIAFEGGDLAASRRWLFAGAELIQRNLARGTGLADPANIAAELRRHFTQEIVWLGDEPGDVPRHHVMMYMVPLDDETVAVGDVRAGVDLFRSEPASAGLELDPDLDGHIRRFERVVEIVAARGLRVVRLPVAVLAGAGAYVTYTNALFEARDGQRVVYLPTYRLPALDQTATRAYQGLGYAVRPIDVSSIYHLNGSLGCLVNVMGRGQAF